MTMGFDITVWIDTLRGGLVESVSRVRALLLGFDQAGAETTLFQSGDASEPVFWRSTAKFIQALSLFHSGAAQKFALTDDELALACASHSGGDGHVQKVAALLAKIDARIDDLHCGPHVPLGPAEARALASRSVEDGNQPTRLHNNCSGKHAGMLAACRARGWPLADYHRLHHPLQQEILRHVSEVSAIPVEQIGTAVDGCGAVVFRTPLDGLARAFQRLVAQALPEPHREAGRRLLAAMRAAPEMVAGPGRLCTNLLRVTAGRVVGKIGADGVYTLGSQRDGGVGLAIKIEDGSGRAVESVLCHLAAHLGLLSPDEFQALRTHWELLLYNHQKELVGEVKVRVDG
jgi:L-asparaginase II